MEKKLSLLVVVHVTALMAALLMTSQMTWADQSASSSSSSLAATDDESPSYSEWTEFRRPPLSDDGDGFPVEGNYADDEEKRQNTRSSSVNIQRPEH